MEEAEPSEHKEERDDLWRETLSSLSLIGSALLLVFLVAQFGRL